MKDFNSDVHGSRSAWGRAALGCLASVAIGLSLAAANAAVAAPPPLSLERLLSVSFVDGELVKTWRSNASLAWSGDQLIFVSPRVADPPQILATTVDGPPRVIATGTAPAVSADGRWMAYLTAESELVVAQLGRGTARTVRTLKRRPDSEGRPLNFGASFAWQMGGHQLVYLSYRGQRRDDAALEMVQLTDPEIRVFDPITGEDRRVHAVSVPLPPKEDRSTYATTAIGGVAMAGDGSIFFVEGEGDIKTGMSAWLKVLKDGQVRTLTRVANDANGKTPYVASDGRHVAMVVSEDPEFLSFSATDYYAMIDVASGDMRVLRNPDLTGTRPSWSADSRRATYVCKTGAVADRLCVIGATAQEDLIGPAVDPLAEIAAFTVSPDGRRVAWLSRDLTDTVRLKVADRGEKGIGAARTVWSQSVIPSSEYAAGEVRAVRWKSFDGMEFEGLLTLPPGYRGGSLPLLVDIHGGSNGGVYLDGSMLNVSPLERQVWAGMGYAHFAVDYRAGFVVDRSIEVFRNSVGKTVYQDNAEDVLAGIKSLVDAGIADPKRVAVLGHSMGSVATTTLLSISDLPAAAVAKEGLEDWTRMPGVRDPAANPADAKTRMFTWRADSPDALRQAAIDGSPMFHPERIRSPVLIIKSSQSKERIEDGQRFVDAVNRAGGEAALLTFPDDYHVVTREANARKMATQSVRWINEHLGVTTPAP